MVKGTTPTFRLLLNDETVDLTQALNVYATFKQGTKEITKSGDDLTVLANEVDVYLEQKETLMFSSNDIMQVQLNWTYVDGRRACSNIIKIPVGQNLIGSVLQ